MLKYKPVTVEKLICTCDRCGRVMEEGAAFIEWQERFIISFRAGYGSEFGDGNYIEGDFCQTCIQSVLGKWLRITADDPFDSKHKPAHGAEKILQPYQFNQQLEQQNIQTELTSILKEVSSRDEKRKLIAERLGVTEDQVVGIALDNLLQSTEAKQTSAAAD